MVNVSELSKQVSASGRRAGGRDARRVQRAAPMASFPTLTRKIPVYDLVPDEAVELLTARRGDLHEAHHEVMECLGRMLWESQRSGRPPDGQAYIEHVRQRATRD